MKLPFVVLGATLLVCVLAEICGLLFLYFSVSRYATYWQERRSSEGEIIYIALGDSAAQGIGASRPGRSYVGVIAKRLERETGKKVRVINLSHTGARIADVLEQQLPKLSAFPKPHIITVEIGANDVSGFDAAEFKNDFSALVQRLPAGTFISDLPDFGNGPDLQNQQYGALIARQEIAQRNDLRFVPLEAYTQKHFHQWLDYSFDFFHPNNHGYKVWADAFWEQIESER